MLLLVIDSDSAARVLTGQDCSGQQLTSSAVERSSVVQGLISDFHGQQCTTTLPMCVESFMAWMHGRSGCLEQDADVLNVRLFPPHRSFVNPVATTRVQRTDEYNRDMK